MALVRCSICNPGPPASRYAKYVKRVEPVGYPDTAAICGRPDCRNLRPDAPGYVWLDTEDALAYERGQRVFELSSHAIRVKVK